MRPAQTQRRRQGQAAVGTPGVAARHRHQPTLGQQFGRLTADRAHAFHPRLDRTRHLRVHRLALVSQRLPGAQGFTQLLRRLLGFTGVRHQAVDQGQARDPLRHRPRQQHGGDRAHGMTEDGETLPAKLLGDLQHVKGIVPQRITGACRTMLGMPMTGKIKGDDAHPLKFRRQPRKARRVIQPAVQRQNRHTILWTVEMSRQLDMRQAQAHFLEIHAHARCSWLPAQRVNS